MSKSTTLIPALLNAALLTTAATTAATTEANSCIQTPAEYADAFERCQPVQCVSPNLYGTISQASRTEMIKPTATAYPSSFRWAWATGHESLQTYAEWHQQACKGTLSAAEVTRRSLLYIGYGESAIVNGADYTLSVMDLSKDNTLFVPTTAAWFEAFEATYNLQIPLETQKLLTLKLGKHSNRTTVAVSPTQNFVDITGCEAKSAASCTDQPLQACSKDYRNAAQALMPYYPWNGTDSATTDNCVSAFDHYITGTGRPANAAQVRALLNYCQDVNPCNSGVGLGFNPSYPNTGGKLLSHFTGREYVFLNQSLDRLGATRIALTPP